MQCARPNLTSQGIQHRGTTMVAQLENTIIFIVCPPQFCFRIVFVFSWDHCKSQEKLEILGGQTKSIMVFYEWPINPAQQDLTSVIKWEPEFSLGKAVYYPAGYVNKEKVLYCLNIH